MNQTEQEPQDRINPEDPMAVAPLPAETPWVGLALLAAGLLGLAISALQGCPWMP